MAESTIQLPPDGSGKSVRTQLVAGVHQQVFTVAGPDGTLTLVDSSGLRVAVTDLRGLTERMAARAPAPGYSLWVDTGDPSYIYVMEAPVGTLTTGTGFRGVRYTLNASGNPVGAVQSNTGVTLTFSNRTTDAGWAS